jgi:hypothetical protein
MQARAPPARHTTVTFLLLTSATVAGSKGSFALSLGFAALLVLVQVLLLLVHFLFLFLFPSR